ncbi:maleylpyruvate isomerase N-terminal domain-containing protein [Streptomyces chartreusis]|uniref:maleylpyruvate isomerase N-terminal domain-containing protein n=1 Tax=Streptomyces chartreusis TaxID=1969 RepID=UPI00340BD185
MDRQLDASPTAHSWLGPPIDARPLFVPEHAALIAGLRGLTPDDWGREAVPGWSVRDVVAHVLGDCYGRLARHRDGHREGRGEGPACAPGEDLPAYIHRINRQWVDAHSRVSPAALTDTLELGTRTGTATDGGNWSMAGPDGGQPAALVRLDTETAWRLCVRGIEPADVLTHAEVEGDRQLAEAACRIVSVVH